MFAQNKTKLLLLFISLIALAGISTGLALQDFADDLIFSHSLDSLSLYEFITESYQSWSGRATLNALMVSTINYHIFWKVGIPLCVVVLCFSISRISIGKFDARIAALSVFLYLLMPKEVLANGSWWVTGFYNYLLPVTAMVYSLSVFLKKERVGISEGVASLLSLFLSCFSEQTSVFTIASIAALMIFDKTYRRPFSYLYAALTAALSFFLFAAPGNYHRLHEETWRWMPGFDSESFINKIMYGYDRIHQAMVMQNGIPFVALCVMSLLIIRMYGNKSKVEKLLSFFPVLHIVLIVLIKVGLLKLGASFYNDEYLSPEKWISYSRFLSYFLTSMVILSVCYSLAVASMNSSEFAKPLVALILAFGTVMMVGFSPTVYASGMRVLYLWDVVVVGVTVFSYCKIYGSDGKMANIISIALISAYFISI